MSYGVVSAVALDPIEKKPLYHYHPGSLIYSVGSVGCNFRCPFCQNHTIAYADGDDLMQYRTGVSPHELQAGALEAIPRKNIGVAYTYNEPTVWYEFMYDTAKLITDVGLKNVMVSNGYIEPLPLHNLMPLMDAFNIDLKGYDNAFYRRMTGGSIEPVLSTLQSIRKAEKHLEISYLVIPQENDHPQKFREMVLWLRDHVGKETVLHINRYFPSYKMDTPPTAIKKLVELYEIAREQLPYVYVGNTGIPEYNHTYCRKCGKLQVERQGMHGEIVGLTPNGDCAGCGTPSQVVVKRCNA